MDQPTLPPGVSLASFQSAIIDFRKVLGDDNVIVDLERLAPYMYLMEPDPLSMHQAAGALQARTHEQVVQVLAIANKYRTPLWPISTGRNFGYGCAAPATPGQLVLDLRGMNRILDVDETLCTALVEPGVTYRQLIDYINERKLKLWVSFPAASGLSGPMGNTLDRGVGYNRNAEHFGNFCGLEVVLANGDVVRTALGGVGDGHAWQNYRWGFGPWVDGIFSQSNLGVVTKMGLWLMRKPEAHKFFMVTWDTMEDMANGYELTGQLKLAGVIDSAVLGETLYGVAMKEKRTSLYQGKGAIPDEIWAKYRKDHGMPRYTLVSNLYGNQEQIDAAFKIISEAFPRTNAKVLSGKDVEGNADAAHAERLGTGVPDLDEFGLYNWRGGGGSAWFAPVVPTRARDILVSMKLCIKVFNKHGFDYIGGMVVNPRGSEHIVDLLYNRADPDEMKRAHACFKEALEEHAKLGYGVYRTNTAFMELASDTYGPAQKSLNASLKRALDPNGIIAPGKSGIHI